MSVVGDETSSAHVEEDGAGVKVVDAALRGCEILSARDLGLVSAMLCCVVLLGVVEVGRGKARG